MCVSIFLGHPVCVCVCVCMYAIYIYIYIYTHREREREREKVDISNNFRKNISSKTEIGIFVYEIYRENSDCTHSETQK